MPIGATGAALIAGGLGAAGGIASSVIGSKAQTSAANNANALQQGMFDKTQANLAPFISGGAGAFGQLNQLTGPGGSLIQPFSPTMDQLSKTPGYQFALDQGLKATQNSYAAKGLGSSGAAMRGAADYAEGLAGTTFQNQFDNYLRNNMQVYNMLLGQSQVGGNAAAGLGTIGQGTGAQMGQNLIGAGNAQAGAAVNAANSVGNAGNSFANMMLLQQLLGKGMGGGGGGIENLLGNSISGFPSVP